MKKLLLAALLMVSGSAFGGDGWSVKSKIVSFEAYEQGVEIGFTPVSGNHGSACSVQSGQIAYAVIPNSEAFKTVASSALAAMVAQKSVEVRCSLNPTAAHGSAWDVVKRVKISE
ncbi:MAG: hypothetical protein HRU19_31145 [Pseudobacteriovorax sp.]|nr:hypothetical protein [Pseudobacteriovorax sp.]